MHTQNGPKCDWCDRPPKHGFGPPTGATHHICALHDAAPKLLEALGAVLEWARTPGDHGGNPYCKEFVKLAELAIAEAKGE